ncbi:MULTISPECIES: STAS/SEC14 domain-containing protein [unclassified Microbulbifer]|uniref:STAS/SEC14 domain-containing protein n=1 Tax=unclassified Microbulbifer TaxID=2619833 RepID=UPI0027E4F920|nr:MULTISPECIES: STAS/SEC14 domain-containing protein [unclassified Microbulbifer]
MSAEHHGVSVGLERSNGGVLLSLHVRGKLTHEDYEAIVPMLESAIAGEENPKIDVFMNAVEMEGWEPRAAWDDLKLGLKHGRHFNRVAVVGSKRWLELMTRAGSLMIGGEARYFENEESAMAWLNIKKAA